MKRRQALEMLNYYNMALYPDDPELIQTLVTLAAANLTDQADGYLLGEKAWPHVTLCQFQSEAGNLESIWWKVRSFVVPTVRFSQLYVKPGTKRHDGYIWVGLEVRQTPELSQLQKNVFAQLALETVDGLTRPDSYHPHLTLGRCRAERPLTISLFPALQFWQREYLFHISIGLSDENGVYQKQLLASSP
ncbi:MAG TPA: 2'-5' RNA ligase family protein [Chroococcales cyanobacterium]